MAETVALFKYWLNSQTSSEIMYKNHSDLPPATDPNYSYASCYYYLNKTSRSFARVIQSLHPELRHAVAIFYLVLRGLDTIEDDMTLDPIEKVKLLQSFHKLTLQEGWNFDGNGPDEKDAILLQEYHVVIKELNSLDAKYIKIIVDITKRMGNGMADFIEGKKVITIDDYNLYTHYVAGLVGIGLTGLFVESGLENNLGSSENINNLANQMGLFLQKVNILKDFLTDAQEGRLFWPKDIWVQYVTPGSGPIELARPDRKQHALACLNHLLANALELVPDCLEYLSKLTDPTVFHFAAIPQVMGVASLALFYNNYDVFEKRGTKIRRGLAVKLIQNATNMENVKHIFLEYAADISKRSRSNLGTNPYDKSFESISIACANIVRWTQKHDKNIKQAIVEKPHSLHTPWSFIFAIAFTLVLMAGQLRLVA